MRARVDTVTRGDGREAVTQGEVVLGFEDVRVSFGAVQALKGISLTLKKGEVHAVVGENGAGKSTLMAVAAGELLPDSGRLQVAGVDRTSRNSPERARELSIVLVHQRPALLPDLTIGENMRVAVPRRMRPPWSATRDWAERAVNDWVQGALDPGTHIRDLTPEAQSIVEISRALVQRPKVLILDEPTENLSVDAVPRLFEVIRSLAEQGTGVIYISHRIGEVKLIADRISVLRDGELRGTFAAQDVSEQEVVDLVAGRAIEAIFPPKVEERPAVAKHLLEASRLSSPRFHEVNLHVDGGEIVGLAGIEGHGQGEILRALAGLYGFEGTVTVAGKRADVSSPRAARASGLLYIPRDRNAEGLMGSLSVRENITTARIETFSRWGVVSSRAERDDTTRTIEKYRIKTSSMEAGLDELSGGNQQKVLVSRVLSTAPRLVLADEPTQGVDVGSRAEIYGFLRDHANAGAGILIVSSDFRELSGLCDRVLVVSQGRIVAELERGGEH